MFNLTNQLFMSHLPHLIIDLTIILVVAAIVSIIFKMMKQPVVLGYLLAGFLVGPNFPMVPVVVDAGGIKIWAEIGVLFLLFGLGLEFSFKKLFKIGGVAAVTAMFGIVFTMSLGYLAGTWMGWQSIDSLFFGGILAIASTTIIIRAFEELNVKNQRFASVVLGVLVIEDLAAVVLMVILTTVSISRSFEGVEMIYSILKLLFFLIIWFVAGIFFLPSLLQSIKKYLSEETLLIVAIGLCFTMVYFAGMAGFSPALGAFIMGSILAETSKAEKIEHLLKPVKNLFGAIFFVSVGMLIDPETIRDYWQPILTGVLILLFGKPFFIICGALVTGQPMRVAVQSGMSLSQIGEFSFIIATLGITLNVTSNFLYPVAVAVSVITTFTTPFMIKLSIPLYSLLEKKLPQKIQTKLNRYSVGSQQVNEVSAWRKLIRFYITNVVIFSVIIFSIITLTDKFLFPLMIEGSFERHAVIFVTLIVLTPFLWALAFRRAAGNLYAAIWVKPIYRGPLLALLFGRIFLVIFFIGYFFYRSYSGYASVVGVALSLLLIYFFRKRIRLFYDKLELRFMTNLKDREGEVDGSKFAALAPWDSHITPLDTGSCKKIAGKKLKDLKLRENYGINIAVIKRGDNFINVPGREEVIYPYDILYVIGTDEQIQKFKNEIIPADVQEEKEENPHQVSLHSLLLSAENNFVNKSIRDSGIRERTKGLVVGVERNGEKILNPESDFILMENDIVWIAGDDIRLKVLAKELLS